MRSILITMLLLLSGVAQALVLDFEETTVAVNGESVTSQGFTFLDLTSDPSGNTYIESHAGPNGLFFPQVVDDWALYLVSNNEPDLNGGSQGSHAQLMMALGNYEQFSLNSFVTGSVSSFSVEGSFFGLEDGWVVDSVLSDDLYYVDLGNGRIEHFLPDSFVGVTHVQFTEQSGPAYDVGQSFYLDNITVNSAFVPVPAAIWLFGSALAGLDWLRQKQAV
jgi:hypothetical protein